jgi:nicotinate (nicotinamide) nucleotide adenylyltransferase
MRLAHKAAGIPHSVAVLAGAFNPPTVAHLALAQSALTVVDEVLLAIPRSFPHKQFDGATLDQRIEMIEKLARAHSHLSAGVAEGGLFVEIAREARLHYPDATIHLLCGRDAAERILTWDYGDAGFVARMLTEFGLLVAPRFGNYVPPERFRHAVRGLAVGDYDNCSSTRLREAIAKGEDCRSLIPDAIAEAVAAIYR